MKVYSVRNNLYALDGDLNVVKLGDLPNPYFFVDEFEKDGRETNLVVYGRGYKAKVIEAKKPSEIPYLRKRYSKTYEADVRYLLRLFIDGVLEIADYRDDIIAFFDIETDKHRKVISLACRLLSSGNTVFISGSEKEIYRRFMDWLVENNVVVLLAWNGYLFDFPIFGKLVGHYGNKDEKIYWDLIEKLDYMFIYDKFVGTERKALDYVAKKNGIEGKVEHTKPIWKMDYDELREYNTRDVDIMFELERKYRLMNIVWELAKMVNLPVSEVVPREHDGKIIGSTKTIIDALLLRLARQRGYVLPTVEEVKRESFEGAYIWARRGLYDWVGVFDINSLYPSIILNEGYAYDLIYDMLKEIYDKRFYYKRIWKEKGDLLAYYKQYALKIIINAMYGVMSYERFRLYNRDFAEKITAKGREIVLSIREFVEEILGYDVIYIDTDSVYVVVGSDDISEFEYIERKINDYISPYSLDWEKTYRRLFIITKKRYAGLVVMENGNVVSEKMDVKGLEMVRGDVFDLLRDMQSDIVYHILKNGWDGDWLRQYLAEQKSKLWSGEYDEKLVYVKGVKDSWKDYKANTPQLRAWKKLGDEKVLFVEYVWTKGGDVEPVVDGRIPKNIDYNHYWELILDMVGRIKDVFVRQKSIFEWR